MVELNMGVDDLDLEEIEELIRKRINFLSEKTGLEFIIEAEDGEFIKTGINPMEKSDFQD